MWTHDESIEVAATPAQVWKLLADVAGWKQWNAGIERIEMHGPFVAGTTFAMKPPGEDGFTSTLLDVRQNEGFVDETVLDGTRVVVDHRLALLSSGKTRITYSTKVTGATAAELGPKVTGDFVDALNALKRLAETAGQAAA